MAAFHEMLCDNTPVNSVIGYTRAYVVRADGTPTVSAYDITNGETSINLLGTSASIPSFANYGDSIGLAFDPSTSILYIVGSVLSNGFGTITAVDVSDPTTPTYLSHIDHPDLLGGSHIDIDVDNKRAWVATNLPNGGNDPKVVGVDLLNWLVFNSWQQSYTATWTTLRDIRLDMARGRGYVMADGHLFLADVSTPGLSLVEWPPYPIGTSVDILADFSTDSFIVASTDTIWAFDPTNASSITLLGSSAIPWIHASPAHAADMGSKIGFRSLINDAASLIRPFDFSNPNAVFEIPSSGGPSQVLQMEVDPLKSLLYAITNDGNIVSVDINNPAAISTQVTKATPTPQALYIH